MNPTRGVVHLVGAGPGDPGLLTLRADDLLRSCDCVVHDYLVNPRILERVPANAERIFVGKRGYADSHSQDEINALLIAAAARHACVVRLKGGDPFLFGRGGEEADALATAGVPFTVVPGITAGIAVPAYAGIPITHRAAAATVTFATGHRQPGADEAGHWAALAQVETLVLYMGMQKLGELAAALIRHGRNPDTPACVIQWGTYARQRVVEAPLHGLAAAAAAAGLGAPAITVIGDVVRYRARIRWFDQRPLHGRVVAVTRSRDSASSLRSALEHLGADVREVPLVQQAPPISYAELDAALCETWDWIAFSSANAVRAVVDRLQVHGRDVRALAGCRLGAVGAATVAALASVGLRADLSPERFSGAELATAILAAGPTPRVLLPQADNATPHTRATLLSGGATVHIVTAYRNLPLTPDADAFAGCDAITLASSGTAERLALCLGAVGTSAKCYAIGPETAATMVRCGLPVAGIADIADVNSLAALVAADLGPR